VPKERLDVRDSRRELVRLRGSSLGIGNRSVGTALSRRDYEMTRRRTIETNSRRSSALLMMAPASIGKLLDSQGGMETRHSAIITSRR